MDGDLDWVNYVKTKIEYVMIVLQKTKIIINLQLENAITAQLVQKKIRRNSYFTNQTKQSKNLPLSKNVIGKKYSKLTITNKKNRDKYSYF